MADTWQPHFIIVTDPMDTFINNIWIPSERTIEMIPFGEIQLEEGKITKRQMGEKLTELFQNGTLDTKNYKVNVQYIENVKGENVRWFTNILTFDDVGYIGTDRESLSDAPDIDIPGFVIFREQWEPLVKINKNTKEESKIQTLTWQLVGGGSEDDLINEYEDEFIYIPSNPNENPCLYNCIIKHLELTK